MLMGSAMRMFDHDWNQKWVCCSHQETDEKNCLFLHCYSLNPAVRDTIKKIPLLKDMLDMAYEITKLTKSPKREAEFHRKQHNFCDKWNVISIYAIWTHQL